MPALITKTFRVTEAQSQKLDLDHKGSSSLLLRALLDIYWTEAMPGIAIIKLRGKLNGNSSSTNQN